MLWFTFAVAVGSSHYCSIQSNTVRLDFLNSLIRTLLFLTVKYVWVGSWGGGGWFTCVACISPWPDCLPGDLYTRQPPAHTYTTHHYNLISSNASWSFAFARSWADGFFSQREPSTTNPVNPLHPHVPLLTIHRALMRHDTRHHFN